jgi:glycosyltransferase involved in cell wall biosynthesis
MAKIVLLYDRFYPQIGGMERKIAEVGLELAVEHEVAVLAKSRPGLPAMSRYKGLSVFRSRPWSQLADRALCGADLVYGFGYTPYSPRCFFTLALAWRAMRKGLRIGWSPVFYPGHTSTRSGAVSRTIFKRMMPARMRRGLRSVFDAGYMEVFRRSAILHALREPEREYWRRLFPTVDIRFVPDGVSSNHMTCTDKAAARAALRAKFGTGPHIVCAGRITEVKNQEIAVSAVRLIRTSFPTARLILSGPDHEERGPWLRRLVAELGMESVVCFAGPVDGPTVCQLYAGCACVVHPSRHEASGLVPLEALAHGTPVIHSARGGLDFYRSLPGCYVVDDVDNPEPWAQAIVHVLRNHEQVCDEARGGRIIVLREYTWGPLVRSIAATAAGRDQERRQSLERISGIA